MEDFLNKLGAAAKRAAGSVATDVSVAAEEQKIKGYYQSLGKLYYQTARRGGDLNGADFADYMRKIDACRRNIAELKNRKNVTDVYVNEDDFVDVE